MWRRGSGANARENFKDIGSFLSAFVNFGLDRYGRNHTTLDDATERHVQFEFFGVSLSILS